MADKWTPNPCSFPTACSSRLREKKLLPEVRVMWNNGHQFGATLELLMGKFPIRLLLTSVACIIRTITGPILGGLFCFAFVQSSKVLLTLPYYDDMIIRTKNHILVIILAVKL